MKTLSNALAAALLLAGVSGAALVADPAVAQKKKDKGDAGFKFSPAVQKVAATAQTALNAGDIAAAETAVAALEAAPKTTDDDRYIAAAFRFDLEQKKLRAAAAANPNAPQDEGRLAAPLEALIASPRTQPDQKAQFAYARGALAYNAKQYPVALQYFTQARQLGSTDANLGLQIVRTKEATGDVAGSLAELDAELTRQTAAGQKPSEDLYRFGLARAMKTGQGIPWMQKYLAAYPSSKNWRDVIITYGFAPGSPAKLDTPQKIDLFRLMRASKSLADLYDYGEYAQKARDRGLPAESLAVLREGMAAGKIPAANSEYKAMLTEVTRAAAADTPSSTEAKAKSAADGKLAAQTAEAYLSQGNYAKAAELYRTALSKGGVNADEVNTRLGIALANGGDKAGAQAAFAAVKGQPRADIAALWTTWINASAA